MEDGELAPAGSASGSFESAFEEMVEVTFSFIESSLGGLMASFTGGTGEAEILTSGMGSEGAVILQDGVGAADTLSTVFWIGGPLSTLLISVTNSVSPG
jgi:hypothetical protein